MQNGQTEPKLYVYTAKALFVHSKKNRKKEKPIKAFLHLNDNPSVSYADSSLACPVWVLHKGAVEAIML